MGRTAPRRRNACLAVLERLRVERDTFTLGEAVAFLYVCENEGINIRELAELAGLTQSSASRTVRRLALTSLVRVSGQARDRRGRIISLTSAGLALRDRIDCLIAAATPIQTNVRQ